MGRPSIEDDLCSDIDHDCYSEIATKYRSPTNTDLRARARARARARGRARARARRRKMKPCPEGREKSNYRATVFFSGPKKRI